jgi:tRNA nucleotidyltransferase/poly(A) polymerase
VHLLHKEVLDLFHILYLQYFATLFGFNIEPKALKACRTYFDHMCKTIPSERIKIEVEKMI